MAKTLSRKTALERGRNLQATGWKSHFQKREGSGFSRNGYGHEG